MSVDRQTIEIALASEDDTIRLGEDLALAAARGDCFALSGDLGAGKSTLARALIRALADDAALEVPSPTFTLVQSYELRLSVAHFDLYRLADGSELDELGLDEALEQGMCLVEWPERAEERLPADRITLRYLFEGPGRRLTIDGPAPRLARIRRVLAIRDFLTQSGMATARRRFLIGDASTRAYELIRLDDGTERVLMDAAERPPGMPIKDGRSYPELVHLALDVNPFIAVDRLLRAEGFAAPAILAADPAAGLLLLEHLGREAIVSADGAPIAERYIDSAEVLAHLHGRRFAREIETAEGHRHRIPDFDVTAIKTEAELLVEWHVPWARGQAATAAERAEFDAIWDGLVARLEGTETNLLLRDYHSPNIVWRPLAEGIARVGILDFQDAMIGPTAYDLASLVQDARVTIAADLASRMMARYFEVRRSAGEFAEGRFLESFAIMAAQRNCKLNGIWVRLAKRDGKQGYLQHMPRTLAYLSSALETETLRPLRDWCGRVGIALDQSGER